MIVFFSLFFSRMIDDTCDEHLFICVVVVVMMYVRGDETSSLQGVRERERERESIYCVASRESGARSELVNE